MKFSLLVILSNFQIQLLIDFHYLNESKINYQLFYVLLLFIIDLICLKKQDLLSEYQHFNFPLNSLGLATIISEAKHQTQYQFVFRIFLLFFTIQLEWVSDPLISYSYLHMMNCTNYYYQEIDFTKYHKQVNLNLFLVVPPSMEHS